MNTQFGKYQILEKLAAGPYSTIFKARLDGIGGFHRLFAIRRLPPSLSANSSYVDRLVEEAKLAGLLSHANIVQILDLGQIDQSYYIAMEYVNGQDLGTILRRCRAKNITLPLPHTLFMMLEALKGLEYAHQRKVLRGGRPVPLNLVHRGLLPSNILASLQGEVKITDFGLSRAHQSVSAPSHKRLSYMSPEQLKKEPVDHRSDIFTLGVVLYEMLCGRHPFLKPSPEATRKAILRHDLKPASSVNPNVPYALEVILEQTLAINPEERFQTAAAFKESLEGFFHDSGFIFSHSTLASFLKGLFPANSRISNPQTRLEQETVPLNSDYPLIDDESEEIPTSLNNVELLEQVTDSADFSDAPLPTATPLDTSISSTSASFGPSGSSNDDSTLILRPPSATESSPWKEDTRVDDADDDHTMARPKLSEEKTSVRVRPESPPVAKPTADDGFVPTASLPPSNQPGQKHTPSPPPAPFPKVNLDIQVSSEPQLPLNAQETKPFPVPDYEESLSGERLPSPPASKPAIVPELARLTPGSHSLAIAGGVGVLALLVGFLLGSQRGGDSTDGPAGAPAAQIVERPQLQITGPVGTRLQIRDRFDQIDQSGKAELTLDPNEPVNVQIQAPGYKPTEYSYTPRANGIRKLTLEWKELDPAP